MESLALLVSIIILTTFMFGPISMAFSRLEQTWARVLGFITGGAGVLAGAWLGTTVDSTGARIMGLLAASLAAFGLWLNWRKQQS